MDCDQLEIRFGHIREAQSRSKRVLDEITRVYICVYIKYMDRVGRFFPKSFVTIEPNALVVLVVRLK